jgi:hypothetical protein
VAKITINTSGLDASMKPQVLQARSIGMADIVGLGGDSAIVSLATDNGHFASPAANTPYRDRSRRAKARGAVRTGGWRRAQRVSASMPCVHKSFA